MTICGVTSSFSSIKISQNDIIFLHYFYLLSFNIKIWLMNRYTLNFDSVKK